jgi:hypothetical protein
MGNIAKVNLNRMLTPSSNIKGYFTMSTHQMAHRLRASRRNPLASGIQFSPAMLQATKNISNLITSGNKALIDFKGSTAVGGKRGTGGRLATVTMPRPVQYVADSQRDQALASYDAAFKALKRSSGKKIFKLTRAQAVAQGLPVPTRHDVQDSINFDVYEALCDALGVNVGTFVDSKVFNRAKGGLRSSGLSHADISAEMNRLGIRGDAKTSYYGSRALAYENPNSRFFNVPYEDVLKGSVLTALGIIPLNNRNMSEVLRELEGQSEVQSSGNIPTQTASDIADLATRQSELAATGQGVTVAEELPSSGDSSATAKGDGEESESPKDEKKKSKALLYGGIAVAVVAVGGLAYYNIQDKGRISC